jgi:hypothetical protein
MQLLVEHGVETPDGFRKLDPGFLGPRRISEKAITAVIQKPMSKASPPARATIWCRRWG